jgi:hypothetical protein
MLTITLGSPREGSRNGRKPICVQRGSVLQAADAPRRMDKLHVQRERVVIVQEAANAQALVEAECGVCPVWRHVQDVSCALFAKEQRATLAHRGVPSARLPSGMQPHASVGIRVRLMCWVAVTACAPLGKPS